jgi:hypothetical protein
MAQCYNLTDSANGLYFSWTNPLDGNFDDIAGGLRTLFELSTLENWPVVMFMGIDSTEIGEVPIRNNDPVLGTLYFPPPKCFVSVALESFALYAWFFFFKWFNSIVLCGVHLNWIILRGIIICRIGSGTIQ